MAFHTLISEPSKVVNNKKYRRYQILFIIRIRATESKYWQYATELGPLGGVVWYFSFPSGL